MLTEDTLIEITQNIPALLGCPSEETLFFDIETTGFSPEYARLYLIGAAFAEGGKWHMRQLLCENPADEAAVLQDFASLLARFRYLIHFNGDRFDIPFVLRRSELCGVSMDIAGLVSVDLYGLLRPLRRLFGLKHMNQKSLEEFLGICREDRYDGGRLIPVYENFCRTRDPSLRRLLLLHNADDIRGMLQLPSLLSFRYLAEEAEIAGKSGAADPAAAPLLAVADAAFTGPSSDAAPGEPETGQLVISFRLSLPLPAALEREKEAVRLSACGHLGQLLLPAVTGTLLLFFPDYQNYYYLPEEDTAVHKSVGRFVQKEFRRRASAKTCYTRASGTFLPQPEEIFTPSFRRCYDDRLRWFIPEDTFLEDPDALRGYTLSLIRWLLKD